MAKEESCRNKLNNSRTVSRNVDVLSLFLPTLLCHAVNSDVVFVVRILPIAECYRALL
jgi:hypothetical protein